MTMISGGDEKVRNAFRATLREEPSRRDVNVNGTQELDASDILEIGDLASAIARAEEVIRLPQPRDMFDVLSATGDKARRQTLGAEAAKTDDCIGPALPAPRFEDPRTPIPPPPSVPPPPPAVPAAPRAPVIMVPMEEDAYYHPMGNIRSFADVTIEGYRPEPTFQIKLRARRHSLGWIVGAVVGPLALLIALSVFLRSTSSPASPASPPATALTAPPPVVTATSAPPIVTAEPASTVPSMDVKKLPAATPRVVRPAPAPAPRKH